VSYVILETTKSAKKVQIASVDWSREMSQAGYMNQVKWSRHKANQLLSYRLH